MINKNNYSVLKLKLIFHNKTKLTAINDRYIGLDAEQEITIPSVPTNKLKPPAETSLTTRPIEIASRSIPPAKKNSALPNDAILSQKIEKSRKIEIIKPEKRKMVLSPQVSKVIDHFQAKKHCENFALSKPCYTTNKPMDCEVYSPFKRSREKLTQNTKIENIAKKTKIMHKKNENAIADGEKREQGRKMFNCETAERSPLGFLRACAAKNNLPNVKRLPLRSIGNELNRNRFNIEGCGEYRNYNRKCEEISTMRIHRHSGKISENLRNYAISDKKRFKNGEEDRYESRDFYTDVNEDSFAKPKSFFEISECVDGEF